MTIKTAKAKFTPPEISKRWGIATEKVVSWIKSGELPAINAATRIGGRSRYLIDSADLADFEARRLVVPTDTGIVD